MGRKCICNRLYKVDESSLLTECAFGGSLCYIHQFETTDGLRFCLTIFSIYDYTHLHFPHDEFKLLIGYLYALQSTRTISPSENGLDVQKFKDHLLTIRQYSLDGAYKIKFGINNLTIGPITAFGLVKTAPFSEVDVFYSNNNHLTCIPDSEICVCKDCPVFKRLADSEAQFLQYRPENVIFFQP